MASTSEVTSGAGSRVPSSCGVRAAAAGTARSRTASARTAMRTLAILTRAGVRSRTCSWRAAPRGARPPPVRPAGWEAAAVIRYVRAHEAERVKALRLRALAADPEGFSSTYEVEAAKPDEWWEMIAGLSESGEEQRTFVATDDAGRWLGFILIRRDDEHPPDAVINATWVAAEARGRGIATALTRACVDWAAERGFPAIAVAAVIGNEAARRTYEAAGFEPASTATWTEHGRTLELLVLKQAL